MRRQLVLHGAFRSVMTSRSSHTHRLSLNRRFHPQLRDQRGGQPREEPSQRPHLDTTSLAARRPLVAVRAAVYATLVPAPQTPEERKKYECGNDSTSPGVDYTMVGAGPCAGPQRATPNSIAINAREHGPTSRATTGGLPLHNVAHRGASQWGNHGGIAHSNVGRRTMLNQMGSPIVW
jgi:hypothetical protein